MDIILLTKHNGMFIGPIANVMGLILNAIYEFLQNFGVEKVAISIIIFTIIVNLILLPLTIKQQESSKILQHINPEVQKLQKKYKGKRDNDSVTKMNAELKAIYQRYGTNQTSGCVTGLIQMPILFALYAVVNRIPAYVSDINSIYKEIVANIQGVAGYEDKVANVLEGLKGASIKDVTDVNSFIDGLSKFGVDQLNQLSEAFSEIPVLSDLILKIENINTVVLGINIANPPGLRSVAIIIPILVGVTQYLSAKMTQTQQQSDESNPMMDSLKTMTNVMPFMLAFMSAITPAGMGIYWITGSVFRIIQQYFLGQYMKKKDIQFFIDKNRARVNRKRKRKGLELIDFAALDAEKDKPRSRRYQPKKKEASEVDYSDGGIAATANIMKNKKYTDKNNKKKG